MNTQPLRLSHSTREILHTCERKFQLERLLKGHDEKETSPYFSRGHAWGAGIQTYLVTGDFDLSLFNAWLAYFPEEEFYPKVFQSRVLNDLVCVKPKLDELRDEYRVAIFNGKPAIELSIRLNINSDYYYVMYVDAVLQNIETKRYGTLELKRTGSNLTDITPLYKNSDQALGYSIGLDQIAGEELSEYDLIYLVGQDQKDSLIPKFHRFVFPKTLYDRLNWFISLGLDVQHLEEMKKINIYPKRGDSCIRFNKPCPHFGICNIYSGDEEKEIPVDENKYQFTYEITEIIENHLRRIKHD